MINIRIAVARLSIALILPAFHPAPAMAAGPSKEAQALLAKRSKEVQKAFKKEANLLVKVLETDLADVESALSNGWNPTTQAGLVFNVLQDFQVAIVQEIDEAADEFRVGTGEAIAILQSAGISTVDRPKGFFFGDCGTTDKHHAGIELEIAKVYAKVHKRLSKTQKAFDKVDHAFNYRVTSPAKHREWIATSGGGGSTVTDRQITVDIGLAVSDRSVTSDMQIMISGSCYTGDGALTGSISYSSGGYTLGTVPVKQGDRWELTLTALGEGNRVIKIRAPSLTGAGDFIAIGAD